MFGRFVVDEKDGWAICVVFSDYLDYAGFWIELWYVINISI